ncbi:MAG: dihydroorotase [Alistipes sp.]|nr:dihydroorotase [Candidatus Minthomonas equi]
MLPFFISPGLVDVHVHFREPGFEEKETVATGSAAAARGGFTTVMTMPNLDPVPDCPENLQVQLDAISRDAKINVIPYASITRGRKGYGEIVDMAALKDMTAGSSDDGSGIQSEEDMRSAMKQASALGCRIVAHCEDNSLLRGGYIHDGRYCREHGHKGICSESEWRQIERDCALAKETGCLYHVCHVSTAESVEIIRQAKAGGIKVTAETCPHYLLLTDDDLQEDGRFKMNPPLRSAADRDALIRGLEDGTIDCIVTDHAPHTAEQKSKGLAHSAMGIVGIETSFPLMYTHFIRTGRWNLPFLIEKMSTAPRRIFGLSRGLEPGMPADIAVFDLEDKYVIDPADFLSKGKATPFTGWEVYGKTIYTFAKGKTAYRYDK